MAGVNWQLSLPKISPSNIQGTGEIIPVVCDVSKALSIVY